ncbi:MAG: argininosuccinate lyase [Syntrophales bacterium]|nr:argininosuccinate lyase [Syntrophales bacterium]
MGGKTRRKLWSGRFSGETNRLVEVFTASLPFDARLFDHDIEGSIAHCRMLDRQGIIPPADAARIVEALGGIREEIRSGAFRFVQTDEDIHMAVERGLIERIGPVGGKVHTGRSRNDQVSTDMRLYLRGEIGDILTLVAGLQRTFLDLARREVDTILPGYTHLQKAQPVLLAHYLLAFREMLERDAQRFAECLERVNVMPLGSAALAGTSLPLDRKYTAKLLGFRALTANSMDAVSDRDFVAEFIFDAGLLMMHLSRLCEDLIIWSSGEFGFVEIADAYTTGSSIMPQKKNPDVAELVRGKTGRVYGNLVRVLTILKGLPMTYNRDLQEDKEPLFDTVDTVKASLMVLIGMAGNLGFNRQRMLEEAAKGFSTATDVAEYLVTKGVPFREAHGIVGRLVAYCIAKEKGLEEISLREFRKFYTGFDDGVYAVIPVKKAVNARVTLGGTAKREVLRQIQEAEKKTGPGPRARGTGKRKAK